MSYPVRGVEGVSPGTDLVEKSLADEALHKPLSKVHPNSNCFYEERLSGIAI